MQGSHGNDVPREVMKSQDETKQNTRRQGPAGSKGKPRRVGNQEDLTEARRADEHPGARSWLFLAPPWLLLSSLGCSWLLLIPSGLFALLTPFSVVLSGEKWSSFVV